jgi:hypothetical protein
MRLTEWKERLQFYQFFDAATLEDGRTLILTGQVRGNAQAEL